MLGPGRTGQDVPAAAPDNGDGPAAVASLREMARGPVTWVAVVGFHEWWTQLSAANSPPPLRKLLIQQKRSDNLTIEVIGA